MRKLASKIEFKASSSREMARSRGSSEAFSCRRARKPSNEMDDCGELVRDGLAEEDMVEGEAWMRREGE